MDLVYDRSKLRMRHLVGLSIVIWVWAAPMRAEGEWPALHVRLVSSINSGISKSGDVVEAVVTAPLPDTNGVIRIAPGARVLGRVREVRSVGLGLRRERARLSVDFNTLDPTGLGDKLQLAAQLAEVDNARETVTPQGQIRGILAADNPHGYLRGVWFRPHSGMFHRSALGMTGLTSRLPVGPLGSVAVMALRCIAFRLPEPEIHLPAGTDLVLAVDPENLAVLPPVELASELQPAAAVDDQLARWLAAMPYETAKPDGKPAQDIINVVAFGSAAQLESGFRAAGWSPTDRMTARSFGRAYKAYIAHKGYPTAPVSKLFYGGREPDLVFQKAFNTLSRRHHVRFWRVTAPGGEETVWLGAGTHDTGVTFDRARLSVTHEIDPRIDRERERVVSDLSFAGCITPLAPVARLEVVTQPDVVTDGALAVFRLRDCDSPLLAVDHHARQANKRSALFRATRRLTLETRHYMMRGNVYYFAYRAIRTGFRSRDPRPLPGVQVAAASRRATGTAAVLAVK